MPAREAFSGVLVELEEEVNSFAKKAVAGFVDELLEGVVAAAPKKAVSLCHFAGRVVIDVLVVRTSFLPRGSREKEMPPMTTSLAGGCEEERDEAGTNGFEEADNDMLLKVEVVWDTATLGA